MSNQEIIRSQIEFPNTHYFVYKNKRYPFKISFFNLCSYYFYQNSEHFQYTKDINLIDEEIGEQLNLQEDTIVHFIKYVQHEAIALDDENVIGLHYLSTKFEVEDLKEYTIKYITSHHKELAIKILSNCQYDSSFNDEIYENIISSNLQEYIDNEELLKLPICTIHRILMKYSENHLEKVKTEKINDFILNMIDRRGREASILLSFARIDNGSIDFFENIIENYSEKVDFQFIDFSIISTFFEILKEQKK
ncbi:hypothetical protein M9Y10_037725 [Tritrichomonas musculus]|uniref:BTB domain-containing protein n=1 Tax=Tritrichomonas musculus TaxID=1915356 RepID=A0ABR2GS08_9EUKA